MKKNALIELLRFIFASMILLFHISSVDYHFSDRVFFSAGFWHATFFRLGNLGVEFFFVVSGYLMAASVYKKISGRKEEKLSIGEETVSFVYKKAKAIFPYYLTGSILVALWWLFEGRGLRFLLIRLPSLFFLHRTGISEAAYLGLSWYIVSMLLAMLIIYPFLKKYYYTFTTLIAPLGGILIIGAMIKLSGSLTDSFAWWGITYKCNMRAIAELAIGTSCFEISRRIQVMSFSKGRRIFFSVTAFLSLLFVTLYICSDESMEYSGSVFLLICYAVVILFSRSGYFADSAFLYENRFFSYLGAISTPVYFLQNLFRSCVPVLLKGKTLRLQAFMIYGLTIALSVIVYEVIGKKRYLKPVRY